MNEVRAKTQYNFPGGFLLHFLKKVEVEKIEMLFYFINKVNYKN
jgi:hypothetical protein